ncbi:leucine--tRNA ligase [Parasediminibacterium sp. JCM 36343]|uniref:leucine--tRNA ligase n=1 Tax=Parasediminibacterium sp. JCM 36343 TaxID=3374279 RepID=UPI003979CF6C
MEYNFRAIEEKWQRQWNDSKAYKVSNTSDKPKYYVLDMFPYPSGAGLHVGHPLGYIASDIYSRYKRLKGFNVLHPMGYDAFGLPAEQYAIEHGVHPAISTEQNIANFRKQLDKIGFCYDWDREVMTSDPKYYKWTQWIFLQLFNSYYDHSLQKAVPITELIKAFEAEGSKSIDGQKAHIAPFTAETWKAFSEKEQQDILMDCRLAYCGIGEVNWCEALGTVLANDEVVNGVSERGGHPVVKKKLRQWYLRITEYADRLLKDLEKLEWSDAMKEMQTNWIGKSTGAEIDFVVKTSPQPLSKGEGQEPALSTLGYFTNTVEQWKFLSSFSKENRKNATEAEAILWNEVRNRKINGFKFRRQHPIAGYIPDFVCLEQKMIVEIDGGYHDEIEQQKFDEARAGWLAEHGYTMLRFTNEEILNQLPSVIEKLGEALPENKNEVPNVATDACPSPLERGWGEVSPAEVSLKVYTTRPDTIFGVDFMVIAPEHELVAQITSPAQQEAVDTYITYVKSRSERERQAEKKITGCFTGAYAINSFDGREIPIWISEYVLAGYGTGAIMAVPCGDERDFKFANHFNIPITNIIGNAFNGTEPNATKDAVLSNSGFLNGIVLRDAIDIVVTKLEEMGIGKRKINYRMRDAAFSRQRYWGEPFPIVWKNGIAYPLPESELPLELPKVDSYSPGPEGEGPLANIKDWVTQYSATDACPSPSERGWGEVSAGEVSLETNTMPGYAGSSWYFLRYMDNENTTEFASRKATDYWNQVDLYIGGTEHAVGHLLYSRMWTKALHDLGHLSFDEPFRRLLNQGMITGSSRFFYWISFENIVWPADTLIPSINLSLGWNTLTPQLKEKVSELLIKHNLDSNQSFTINRSRVDVNIVDGVELNINVFINGINKNRPAKDYFIMEDGCIVSAEEKYTGKSVFICDIEVEKMSKSKYNTVNPDDLVVKFGADTFRMYEMFLGPIEQSKPWDTKGIEGVHRFLKKLWRLFYDELKGQVWNENAPTPEELKILHRTIKKIEDDTERFSFNTAVSAFMVCVNDLADTKCHKKAILEQVLILLTPYAPHIAEELWHSLGNETLVIDAPFPKFEAKYVTESTKDYPVSINGKVRANINIGLDVEEEGVKAIVLENEVVQKWLEGKDPKKIVFVKNRMINVVI